jgi:hypothetical protein
LLPIAVLFHAENEADKKLADNFAAGAGERKEVEVRRFSIKAEVDRQYLIGCRGIAFIFPSENHAVSPEMYSFICDLDTSLNGKLTMAVNPEGNRQAEMMIINNLLTRGMLIYAEKKEIHDVIPDGEPEIAEDQDTVKKVLSPENEMENRGRVFSEKVIELFG